LGCAVIGIRGLIEYFCLVWGVVLGDDCIHFLLQGETDLLVLLVFPPAAGESHIELI
jgi:hypothetical protein